MEVPVEDPTDSCAQLQFICHTLPGKAAVPFYPTSRTVIRGGVHTHPEGSLLPPSLHCCCLPLTLVGGSQFYFGATIHLVFWSGCDIITMTCSCCLPGSLCKSSTRATASCPLCGCFCLTQIWISWGRTARNDSRTSDSRNCSFVYLWSQSPMAKLPELDEGLSESCCFSIAEMPKALAGGLWSRDIP